MARINLLELANRTQNGNVIEVVESLSEVNDFLKDAHWEEANDVTSHHYVRRISLPTGTFRMINQGVPAERSLTKPMTTDMCMLEGRSEIDKKLVKISGNPARFRSSEDLAFVEGMNQTFADQIIYGTRVGQPERINGLATLYNTLGTRVLGASGTGSDTTSIWFLIWGPRKVYMVYPKGHPTMGIEMQDLGEIDLEDADGNKFRGYATLFDFNFGLIIEDDRAIGRIANIESAGTSNIFDPKLVNKLKRKMLNGGKGAIAYANSTVLAQIDNDIMNKANVTFTTADPYGDGAKLPGLTPIRQVDAILDSETAIT